jgi:pimeloyl-ACP methyl ester carboxylesterase
MTSPLATDSRGAGGLPVVFAHSFAGDLSHWDAAMNHLQSQRRVVAFDFRGHGNSPRAPEPCSYAELSKDIGQVADANQLESFVLVGHSMGAAIASEFSAAHAKRVKALILVDPPPAPGAVPPEQIRQISDALDQDPYAVVEQFWNQQMLIDTRADVRQKLLTGLRRMSRQTAADLTREAFAVDTSAALRRYAGPRFAIVTPRNDSPLSLHNAVPGVTHAVVTGTGHWIHLGRPDEFHRVLDEFLKRA